MYNISHKHISMEVITEILGNANNPEWHNRLFHGECAYDVENVFLDQWTAQKSRFLAKGDKGNEYPIALKRGVRVADGDVVAVDDSAKTAVVLRLALNDVLVIDLEKLNTKTPEEIIRISVELGHAIGNQHWPAVIKGTKVYVPMTVDKKVMLSVLDTHHIEDISYKFEAGSEVIPYLAPHEIRGLFGGASHENTELHDHSHFHKHDHGHIVH